MSGTVSLDRVAHDCGLTVGQLSCAADQAGTSYREFNIPKKSGGVREITPPDEWLKRLQRRLLVFLRKVFTPPGCVHGGVSGKSIRTNAEPHVGQKWVLGLDVRDFYPSTTAEHLLPVLKHMGLTDDTAATVCRLTTYRGSLPQGAPTSLFLGNVALWHSDRRILKLSERHRLAYTRYVDDITVSGGNDLRTMAGAFEEIVRGGGYEVGWDKSGVMGRHQRQVVTGLVVNDRLRPTKDFLRALNDDIWLCLDYGADLYAALEGIGPFHAKQRLNGRVRYVSQFDPKLAERLRRRLYDVDWGGRQRHRELAAVRQ